MKVLYALYTYFIPVTYFLPIFCLSFFYYVEYLILICSNLLLLVTPALKDLSKKIFPLHRGHKDIILYFLIIVIKFNLYADVLIELDLWFSF